jgi:hypothetical protein
MTILRFLLQHPVKTKRIKIAAGSSCEICGRAEALENLEVHSFLEDPEDRYFPADLEQFLIILCHQCHGVIHSYPITLHDQELLVRQRPESIREIIRVILAYVPKPYTPPEIDMEDAFREASAPHTRY